MMVPGEHLRIGRVVNKDDKFMLIEIPKDMGEKLTIQQGDEFFTLLFVHQTSIPGELESWLPWEEA